MTIRELDAQWPTVKRRLEKANTWVIDAARQYVDAPTRVNLEHLEAAVAEQDAADRAEYEHHMKTGAALREPRRAEWELEAAR